MLLGDIIVELMSIGDTQKGGIPEWKTAIAIARNGGDSEENSRWFGNVVGDVLELE